MKRIIALLSVLALVFTSMSVTVSVNAYSSADYSIDVKFCGNVKTLFEVDYMHNSDYISAAYVMVNDKRYDCIEVTDDDDYYIYSVTFKAEYSAKIGDTVSYYVELTNGETVTAEKEIKKGDGKISVVKNSIGVLKYTFASDKGKVDKTYVTVNGKKYKSSSFTDYEYYDDEDYDYFYKYQVKLKSKVYDRIITVVTTDGYTYKKTVKSKKDDSKISIDKKTVDAVEYNFSSSVHKVNKTYITVNGKDYKSSSLDDGKYSGNKFSQDFKKKLKGKVNVKVGDKIIITVVTNDGAIYKKTVKAKQVKPKIELLFPRVGDLDLEGFTEANSKVTIKLKNKTYKVKAEKDGYFSRKIPRLKKNTKVSISVVTPQKCKNSKTITVKAIDGRIKVIHRSVNSLRYCFSFDFHNVKKTYFTLNGKKHKVKKDTEKSYYDSYIRSCYYYDADYHAKVGDKIKITVVANNGYKYNKKIIVKQEKPIRLKVNKVYVGDNKVSGKTESKSKVVIKVNKKTYKTRSDSKGFFSQNVKPVTKKAKIKVFVTTPQKCKGSDSFKAKILYGNLSVQKYIYRTTKTIKVNVTNSRAGDKVVLKLGGKTYTKKLKSNCKGKKSMKFSVQPAAAGTKVKVNYYNRFGTKKDSTYSAKVYYGNKISIGMSMQNVLLTTWGKPDRRNNYNGSLEWIYERGDYTLYVDIENGVVTRYTEFNY